MDQGMNNPCAAQTRAANLNGHSGGRLLRGYPPVQSMLFLPFTNKTVATDHAVSILPVDILGSTN